MFDVGFSELLLVAAVALIVIGPERLPRVARMAGMWVGRARRALNSVKQEIDRELRAEELKEILRKQAESQPLERLLDVPPAKPAQTSAQRADAGSADETGRAPAAHQDRADRS